jgi:hypothetical protein
VIVNQDLHSALIDGDLDFERSMASVVCVTMRVEQDLAHGHFYFPFHLWATALFVDDVPINRRICAMASVSSSKSNFHRLLKVRVLMVAYVQFSLAHSS